MKWVFGSATELGGREEQQDCFEIIHSKDNKTSLAIVTDGLGAHKNSAQAASLVIEVAKDHMISAVKSSDTNNLTKNPREFLQNICHTSHRAIRELANETDSNPATTCMMLMLFADEAHWIHVGDSRLYHCRGREIVFRTTDHAINELDTEQLKAFGIVDRTIDAQNKIYMCLGGKNKITPEYGACAVDKNDWFILCTDGVWDRVPPGDLVSINCDPESIKISATNLAKLAVGLDKSDADNASLIIAVPDPTPDTLRANNLVDRIKRVFT